MVIINLMVVLFLLLPKFTSQGDFLSSIGGDSDAGLLKLPTAMAVDDNGNLYVVDFGNNRIRKFAPTGNSRPDR
ncbi:MAG: hypothetical protein DRH08_09560 [Deltaproteobacteria bacterium]|nr:MAG: hypothetical protein DRH08_09560 [Deltaproteobacteria bacterium]